VLAAVGANLRWSRRGAYVMTCRMPRFPMNTRGAIGSMVNDVEEASVSLGRRVGCKSRKCPNR
jgi:hypothetical protein